MSGRERTREELAKTRAKAKAMLDWDDSIPIDEESLDFAQTLYQESDRGAILVGLAGIDERLVAVLHARFLQDEHVIKKAVQPLMNGGLAPLGTVSARSRLAYALGLVDRQVFDAIDRIRKLRNKLAHGSISMTLDEEVVKPILESLHLHQQMALRAFRDVIRDEVTEIKSAMLAVPYPVVIPGGLSTARVTFAVIVVVICGVLESSRLRLM